MYEQLSEKTKEDLKIFGVSLNKTDNDISNNGKSFDWDKLYFDKFITNLISKAAILELEKLVTNGRLMAHPKIKYKIMSDIMKCFGFTLFHSGTNRRIYQHYAEKRILFKVAVDRQGMQDNILEFHTQNLLRPFCPKMFEITPSGVIGMQERVHPITTPDEFRFHSKSIVRTIYQVTAFRNLILEDIGADYFMNWGVRDNFGPVLLDYPYVYELDASKLMCKHIDSKTHIRCTGEIDYDIGCNQLECKTCHTRYPARYLAKNIPNNGSSRIIKWKEGLSMKFFRDKIKPTITDENGNVLEVLNPSIEQNNIPIVNTGKRNNRFNKNNIKSIKHNKSNKIEIDESLKKIRDRVKYNKQNNHKKEIKEENHECDNKVDTIEITERDKIREKFITSPEQIDLQKNNEKVTSDNIVKPTKNLFIEKKKTSEELTKELYKKNNFNDIVGIPTISLAEENVIEEDKNKFTNNLKYIFDGFLEYPNDRDIEKESLIKSITKYYLSIYTDKKKDDIKVDLIPITDEKNYPCYNVDIYVDDSPFSTVILYPINIYNNKNKDTNNDFLDTKLKIPDIGYTENNNNKNTEVKDDKNEYTEQLDGNRRKNFENNGGPSDRNNGDSNSCSNSKIIDDKKENNDNDLYTTEQRRRTTEKSTNSKAESLLQKQLQPEKQNESYENKPTSYSNKESTELSESSARGYSNTEQRTEKFDAEKYNHKPEKNSDECINANSTDESNNSTNNSNEESNITQYTISDADDSEILFPTNESAESSKLEEFDSKAKSTDTDTKQSTEQLDESSKLSKLSKCNVTITEPTTESNSDSDDVELPEWLTDSNTTDNAKKEYKSNRKEKKVETKEEKEFKELLEKESEEYTNLIKHSCPDLLKVKPNEINNTIGKYSISNDISNFQDLKKNFNLNHLIEILDGLFPKKLYTNNIKMKQDFALFVYASLIDNLYDLYTEKECYELAMTIIK